MRKKNKILNQVTAKRPASGSMFIREQSDRSYPEESAYMAMSKIDAIMAEANSGEPGRLYKLAAELLDKNWDIQHAVGVRVGAVKGVKWSVQPVSGSSADKTIANALQTELQRSGSDSDNGCSTGELIGSLAFGVYTGCAVSEIIWKEGGSLAGFSPVPLRYISFRDSFSTPSVLLSSGERIELEKEKFIRLLMRDPSGDPSRGGLIRTLAYLHCFFNLNVKYLLRFLEKYGMPFVVAKVGSTAWDNERDIIKRMILSFGPDGGGVFSKDVEVQLLQANTSSADVYFKLLDYADRAVRKVVLGQTASSSDGGGLSKDNAQSQVRQDLLEADCALLEDVVNAQFVSVWTRFNYGEAVIPPRFVLDCTTPEDFLKKAQALEALGNAYGAFSRMGGLTVDLGVEIENRRKLGLPPPSQEVIDEYARLGGVKRPVTLKFKDETSMPGMIAASALPAVEPIPEAVQKWGADAVKKVLDFAEGRTDKVPVLALSDFDVRALADYLAGEMIDAAAAAKLTRGEELAPKLNGEKRV